MTNIRHLLSVFGPERFYATKWIMHRKYAWLKRIPVIFILLFSSSFAGAQESVVTSPNGKIRISLHSSEAGEKGRWHLQLDYLTGQSFSQIISRIDLGLVSSGEDFSQHLRLKRIGRIKEISEEYTVPHGKRSRCFNRAREVIVTFENQNDHILDVIIRAYDDGLVFRYGFPAETGSFRITDEHTVYHIPDDHLRWLEEWTLANEELYKAIGDQDIRKNWAYPALFCTADTSCWYLIHEAELNRTYCGTKLSNLADKSAYKVMLPADNEGDGEAYPSIKLPWKSPWRVIIVGDLATIVGSTLVNDVSAPSVLQKTDWIKPGLVSWNYWSNNHGTKDYQVVCEFADLAAAMNWPYTLLDWEWDAMENGGNVEDAADYILSKGVRPLIWYNAGVFKWIQATPRDRMLTHENRTEEFAKLKKMGFAGVKIDFFLSEKQDMIGYYLDILDDAASHEMMVYFHGCLVPRGWARTYPHLMTLEGVRGAEWYNNGPELTSSAPEHNTILPFTRNVVGSMDYTPVTFTNSQYPHVTSYGHELALSVIFESALQHMADRPSGYYQLPDAARTFLKMVPAAWDDTRFLKGFPGKDILIAREKAGKWYIGGINAEKIEKTVSVSFNFLPEGKKYKLTLIADGEYNTEFMIRHLVVDQSSRVDVHMLRRGGFAAFLEELLY